MGVTSACEVTKLLPSQGFSIVYFDHRHFIPGEVREEASSKLRQRSVGYNSRRDPLRLGATSFIE